ncbi:hypothetical protein [Anaeromicrobium sediminis]|uniref:Uncharacterized protein n=1 Tax=Anaeromicrobium sediminis TaxID=1478221 RepID=A0A267MET7_9FIRM|nr:hypothetical protein [Anaeromicrobium sediminis]PAB57395.1 hypothetical protein CCE28_19055 [Anaeromicrobium sediminis]
MNDEFVKWLEKNDLLYERFCELNKRLTSFLYKYTDDNSKTEVCNRFSDVLKNCDVITYDEEGVSAAYTVLHFMDRYHRFQLVFLELLEKGILPIKSRIDILDLGSGPGPSMYAMSDMYELYRKFEIEKKKESKIKEINIDYVERSNEFTNFLHHFTEYANYTDDKVDEWKYHVPYHHTIFRDINDLVFNEKHRIFRNEYEEIEGEWYQVQEIQTVKRRYDLAVLSNFLTNVDMVERFNKQLKDTAFFLRNRGLFVVVGAIGSSEKYRPVYEEIDKIILKNRYRTKRFEGYCNKVLSEHRMEYSFSNDRFGKDVISTIKDGVTFFTDNELEERLDKEFLKDFNKWIAPDYNKSIKWEVNAYKRRSWLRKNK